MSELDDLLADQGANLDWLSIKFRYGIEPPENGHHISTLSRSFSIDD